MAVLQVQGLKKSYGDNWALKGIDLQVQPGEIFGFLGANGAGKTTFTRCVSGLIHPTEGTIAVNGISLPDRTALQHVGLLPDQFELYAHLTARENLAYFAALRGVPERRVDEVLAIVGMESRADVKGSDWSHGMKQRVGLGQAILHKPKLLMLDEPGNGLDPQGVRDLRALIRSIAKQGIAVFLNSHLLSEVEAICDRVAVVKEGSIVAEGDPKSLGAPKARISLASRTDAALEAAQTHGSAAWEDNVLVVSIEKENVPALVASLVGAGAEILAVSSENRLEEEFLRLMEDA